VKRLLGILLMSIVIAVGCGKKADDAKSSTAEKMVNKDQAAEMQAQKSADAEKNSSPDETKLFLMETSMGDITLELNYTKAPITCANFEAYVDNGHYNGTIFHRVIANFMIQGGGFDAEMNQKTTLPQIQNEAANGLKNDLYTIAMARTGAVHSATSQFFINVKDNSFLNHRSQDPQGFGYCVFGKVTKGADIVDKIKMTPTGDTQVPTGQQMKDVPKEIVKIVSISKIG
jgi:peptidyl-prolyl cis-trans isomerase B (cyclophilin B)